MTVYNNGYRVTPMRRPQGVETTTESGRRCQINSPTERDTIVRRFLFYGWSVTKLALERHATERAVENVLRLAGCRIYPAAEARKAAA
jgi:hypothetical protein